VAIWQKDRYNGLPKSRSNAVKDSVIEDLHVVAPVTMSSGSSFSLFSLALFPTRGAALADQYTHVRFLKMKFRLHVPNVAPASQPAMMGYIGGVQDVAPATVAQIGELLPSTVFGSRQTVPSNWVNVPRADLAGALPWYKTIAGGADATEEAPGYICFFAGTTDILLYEIFARVECKTAVAAGNSPVEVELREKLRLMRLQSAVDSSRKRLLGVLSPPNLIGKIPL
jgi:hypothetical protein